MGGYDGKKLFLFLTPVLPCTFHFFRFFSKKSKQAILFHDFLHEKCVNRKNGVHHDEQHGKKQENSHLSFFILETLSQRFLQNIFRHFQFFEKIKMTNSLLLTQISSNHFLSENRLKHPTGL